MLALHVDAGRWRAHQKSVLAAYPGLVPVTKGNGYGFGNARLAGEATGLGVDLLAVGTYGELPSVHPAFSGDVLVLTPWRPGVDVGEDRRVIHTVSRATDLDDLLTRDPDARVIIELETSMRRHGVAATELDALTRIRRLGDVVGALAGVRREGWALHLPLPGVGRSHRTEVSAWIDRLSAAGLAADTLFVSHVGSDHLAALRASHPDVTFRPRVGTALWLGDRSAYSARATVLDVHPVRRGDRFGYRQRRIPRHGHLVVAAGGTAHGIALEAPSHVGSLRERVKTAVQGGLEAAGQALSPYTIGGRRRWFAEPPHMQVSLLFVPSSVPPPEIGEELEVNVGMTTTTFDAVVVD